MTCHSTEKLHVPVDRTGPLGPPAFDVALSNLGAMQAQEAIHAPHTRHVIPWTATFAEVDNTTPHNSAVVQGTIIEPVNYVILNPSVRFNPVALRLGTSAMEWLTIGGTVYPNWEYYHDGVGPSKFYRIPLRRSWSYSLVAIPTAYAQNYQDAGILIFGYLPDAMERIQS